MSSPGLPTTLISSRCRNTKVMGKRQEAAAALTGRGREMAQKGQQPSGGGRAEPDCCHGLPHAPTVHVLGILQLQVLGCVCVCRGRGAGGTGVLRSLPLLGALEQPTPSRPAHRSCTSQGALPFTEFPRERPAFLPYAVLGAVATCMVTT